MFASIVERYPALGFPLYRRYWFASLASVGAFQIVNLGQLWLVFELSGSALDLGILGAAASVPTILMTLIGGTIADRWDKRTLLLITSATTATALFTLALLDALNVITVWHVWIIAAITASISGVDWPTRQSFFPYLIERPAMLSAVALNSILWQSTRMIVPALGGVLLAWSDTSVVFFLGAAGFLVMYVVISGIDLKIGGSRELSPVAQMVEGFRFIAGNELFRHLMLLSFATMFFASSYMQLMPAFADLLDAGETGYGMLLSATGVGSVIGTVVVGAANPTRNYGMFMLACAGTSALGLYGFAFATLIPSYPLALLACAIAAAFVSVFLILSTTAMQVEVPDALRGRVMGIHGITYSLMPLGGLVLGAAGDYVGVSAAVMISATVFLGILMIITTASTRVRQLQSPQLNA